MNIDSLLIIPFFITIGLSVFLAMIISSYISIKSGRRIVQFKGFERKPPVQNLQKIQTKLSKLSTF